MKKFYTAVIFIITMMFGSSMAFAGPDDIVHDKGFNNLYWGQTLDQIVQNYDINRNDYEVDGIYTKYKIHKDFLYVYNVKAVPTIEIYFYHDKLAKIEITFLSRSGQESWENGQIIIDGIINNLGKPKFRDRLFGSLKGKPRISEWNRTDTAVTFTRYDIRDNYYSTLEMEDGSLR